MGHLLASVNQEAADAIHPAPERRPLPDVGDVVIYHMRQGHGRDGRTRFPALVQGRGDRDTLMLTVIVDASEPVDESLVSEIGVGNEFHCWERRDADPVRPLAERLAEPAGLRGIVASLETAVFGDFDRPRISIIDIMQSFEDKLKAMRTELDAVKRKKK